MKGDFRPTGLVLFHSTSTTAAGSIEQQGFVDADFEGVLQGVCLASRPLDVCDGVARYADVCFEVTVPSGFELNGYEIAEEGRPEDAYREWLLPAAIVNEWGRRNVGDPGSYEAARHAEG